MFEMIECKPKPRRKWILLTIVIFVASMGFLWIRFH